MMTDTNSNVTNKAEDTRSDAAENRYQDLGLFRLASDFRGRYPALVQLWWIVQATVFGCSPQFMYGWRRAILRLFGAKIGRNVLIRPSVRVTYPWRLTIGDGSWIGDDVGLYTLGPISIGRNAVVSQGSYLCTGTHDYRDLGFAIDAKPIVIDDEVWVAAQVFISPGVRIGRGAVVGVRSLVLSDIPGGVIAMGHPATVRKLRPPNKQSTSPR
jgi:putative colanic acid biosynthesis acetyltransferase WcaF